MEMLKFSSVHHVDQKTINNMYNSYSPVFILSTGRSGTKFLATLLDHSSNIISFHEAEPRLQYFSNFAYHNQDKKDMLTKMIDGARMELILDVYIKNKIFVECNQCLAFFAPAIKELIKKSKFVHIVRHPGDFVRSAIRKGWHVNDSIWESGRIQMMNRNEWESLDQIERLSWVWCTTNQFLEDFKKLIEPERVITFKIEELFKSNGFVVKFLKFISAEEVPTDVIKETQETRINELVIHKDEPPNMKKIYHFPNYVKWENELKGKVKIYSQELATQYGYEL